MNRLGGLVMSALLLTSACSLLVPSNPKRRFPEARPRVAVEVYRGFTSRPGVPPDEPERVEVLLDMTASMAAPTVVGPGRFVAAQHVTRRLVRNLPAESFIGLHALGVADAAECTSAVRTDHSGSGEARDALLHTIEDLRPVGEASLAEAIEGLRVYLGATETLARTRVVVLSDLGSECGGDVCGQVRRMVAAGARLELVVFGDVAIPDCLRDFEIPGAWRVAANAPQTAFRIESREIDITAVTEGVVGGEPVAASPGAVRIIVDLDPPLEFGPVELAPASTSRLRILDFPALDPPVREAVFESDGGEAERVSGRDTDEDR